MDLIKPGASCPEVYQKFLQKFSALGFEPISFVAHGIGLHLHEEPYMGRYGNQIVEAGMVVLIPIPGTAVVRMPTTNAVTTMPARPETSKAFGTPLPSDLCARTVKSFR